MVSQVEPVSIAIELPHVAGRLVDDLPCPAAERAPMMLQLSRPASAGCRRARLKEGEVGQFFPAISIESGLKEEGRAVGAKLLQLECLGSSFKPCHYAFRAERQPEGLALRLSQQAV